MYLTKNSLQHSFKADKLFDNYIDFRQTKYVRHTYTNHCIRIKYWLSCSTVKSVIDFFLYVIHLSEEDKELFWSIKSKSVQCKSKCMAEIKGNTIYCIYGTYMYLRVSPRLNLVLIDLNVSHAAVLFSSSFAE